MWKFMRGKGHQPTAERLKLQKELFAFKKTVHHGFPNRPSALAWDPQLKVMAIGTRTGTVKIYGAPGVEFYGEHENECSVMQLFFLPNQGRLISLCDDNTLHLWEINLKNGKSEMEEVKSCSLEGRLKKISTCCLQSNAEHLLIGTEGGNIYLLDVKSFEMTDHIIYQDVVMQNVPDDYKVNPGAVEAISEHPTDPSKILIGYNRGLLVLWDNNALNADQTYVGSQQLESISWHRKGTQFMSAHNDGSFIIWSTNDSTRPEQAPNTPYGPFPCKAINKIQWRTAKRGDFIIFSGGMPRASFGDRHTVSVMQEEKHLVFDFTSRVVDFFIISDSDDESEFDNPNALVVLAEEEMLVIDIESEDWPVFRTPYLASLHSSAITCAQHYTDVPQDLWNKIIAAGKLQTKEAFSQREWPIVGGKTISEAKETRDLLLTGHEDGTVRMWDASGVALYPLYKLSTAQIFTGEENNEQNAGEESEEWPPFRKVGSFDPYSDDPRLAVKKMCLCILSGTMVVAGTSGQILIFHLNSEEVEKEIEVSTVNIVGDRDNFVWKGHDQLQVKGGSLKFGSGFQPSVIMQILPPAACTALVLGSDCSLVGAGTSHGLALFDYIQKKSVIVKCTLNPNDISGVSDMTMSRRKSFKKSLRESFRRLRKGRSQRNTDKKKSPSRSSSSVEEKSESEDAFSTGIQNCSNLNPVQKKLRSAPWCMNCCRQFNSTPQRAEIAQKPGNGLQTQYQPQETRSFFCFSFPICTLNDGHQTTSELSLEGKEICPLSFCVKNSSSNSSTVHSPNSASELKEPIPSTVPLSQPCIIISNPTCSRSVPLAEGETSEDLSISEYNSTEQECLSSYPVEIIKVINQDSSTPSKYMDSCDCSQPDSSPSKLWLESTDMSFFENISSKIDLKFELSSHTNSPSLSPAILPPIPSYTLSAPIATSTPKCRHETLTAFPSESVGTNGKSNSTATTPASVKKFSWRQSLQSSKLEQLPMSSKNIPTMEKTWCCRKVWRWWWKRPIQGAESGPISCEHSNFQPVSMQQEPQLISDSPFYSSSKQTPVTDLDAPTPTEPLATVPPDTKPIERQVEARTADDAMGSIVRCLYLAQSFIISVANTTLTLWAGTNSGAVYVFTVSLPSKEKRKEVPISCQLGKEIQLKHRAPVIAICIIDASNCPLPDPFEVEQERAKSPDNNGCHRVVICSEEQFKVFTLPSLKPYCKFKLTAHEGARVRKIGFVNFRSRSDANYHEYCITCLTNQGDVSIYTIPELRRQLASGCIKREDINGISSLVFSRNGQGFYLHSSSEMQRFSLSAHNITEAHCTLELPEGMRPLLEPEKLKIEENVPETQTIQKIGLDSITDDGKEEEKLADHNESSIIEEVKKDDSTGDITIDSVRDHLVSSTEESHITITERKEEKVEIKEESVTVIQTTTILAATETTGANEDDPSPDPAPTTSTPSEIKRIGSAPIASIDELNMAEDYLLSYNDVAAPGQTHKRN